MHDACEGHTAFLYDRGGITRIGELGPLISLQWQRIRDDISVAQVVMKNPDCAAIASQVEPGRHELVIFRGGHRVWEGPITLATYERAQTTIEAKDVVHYLERLIMRNAYNNAYPNVVTTVQRALNIISGELPRREAEDPPVNVLPYLHGIHQDDDAKTARNTLPFQKTVFDDLDDLAAKSGIDYTCLGRSIFIFDTHTLLGRTPTLTESDIVGDVVVSVYGMDLATFAAVSGADGTYGSSGEQDAYYGWVEILASAYDENADADEEAPTQAELNSQAERNLSGRNPTPVNVRIPDGSTLNPNGPISLDDLVPGVEVPLLATMTGRTFSQMQKLDKVDVADSEAGETIQITLSPASALAGQIDEGE
jgi:hypothetical protein